MKHRFTDSPIHRSGGFTLIELVLVLTILGLLVTLALPEIKQNVIRAKEAALQEDLFVLRKAIDGYYADKQQYPPDLSALAEEGYVRRIPRDPFTDSAETWVTVPPEGDEAEGGVFDVHSGYEGTALDGTAYGEW